MMGGRIYSIHLVTMELDNIGPNAHHNYLSFRNSDGEEEYAIHGLSMDRKTGHIAAYGDGNSTLRVIAFEGQENEKFVKPFPIVSDVPVFEGNYKDFAQKRAVALDAGNFINRQNLNYVPITPIGTAQNSNSVAHSLVDAMGLKFPEDIERHFWAPGHDRILLPTDWSSEYDKPYDRSILALIGRKGVDYALYPKDVVKDVLNDGPDPRPSDETFFDRDKPFTPYTPMMEDLDKKFDRERHAGPVTPSVSHSQDANPLPSFIQNPLSM